MNRYLGARVLGHIINADYRAAGESDRLSGRRFQLLWLWSRISEYIPDVRDADKQHA